MLVIFLIILIVILAGMLWKYQRQIKDICRQIAFLREHDSNMMVTTQICFGGLGTLAENINELLLERRERKKEADQKEAEIAEVYTSLSHDIRTPLTSLDGYFQLLEESKEEDEKQRYLQIIQERIRSLKDMLEELFTYTKLQSGAYQMELEMCRLGRILKETIFSYYEEWLVQGIEPEISITEEEIEIEGNSPALRRIIQNLIKNGLDHGQKKIHIRLQQLQDQASLSFENLVQDPEVIEIAHVFDRFYKGDEARSHTSTGLGLSIAKELTERMGGTIQARMQDKWFIVEIQFPLRSGKGLDISQGKF